MFLYTYICVYICIYICICMFMYIYICYIYLYYHILCSKSWMESFNLGSSLCMSGWLPGEEWNCLWWGSENISDGEELKDLGHLCWNMLVCWCLHTSCTCYIVITRISSTSPAESCASITEFPCPVCVSQAVLCLHTFIHAAAWASYFFACFSWIKNLFPCSSPD